MHGLGFLFVRWAVVMAVASLAACGRERNGVSISRDPARNVPSVRTVQPIGKFESMVAERALGAVDTPTCGAVTVRVFVEFQRDGYVRRVWPVEPPPAPSPPVTACIARKLSRARMPPIASQMDAPPVVSWLTR